MTEAQLELSLGGVRVAQFPRASPNPSALTAHWWFQRMRQMVDCTFDWQPAPPDRPEQIWLLDTPQRVGGQLVAVARPPVAPKGRGPPARHD